MVYWIELAVAILATFLVQSGVFLSLCRRMSPALAILVATVGVTVSLIVLRAVFHATGWVTFGDDVEHSAIVANFPYQAVLDLQMPASLAATVGVAVLAVVLQLRR